MTIKDIEAVRLSLKIGFESLYKERLKGLYIFGSYARGQARADSDLDVLVVLDTFLSAAREIDFSSQLVSDLSLEYGVSISRVAVRESDWLENQKSFIQIVRREAVAA